MVRIVDPIGEGRIEGPVVQLEVAVEAPEVGRSEVPDSTGQKISEAGYLKRVERLESLYGTKNVHSLEKHGAQTTGMKQYRRVQHKDYPNPTTGAPGNKTKTASIRIMRKHFCISF